MADFDIAFRKILETQGMAPFFEAEEENGKADPLLCSSCFYDAGLRAEARVMGAEQAGVCPNCGLDNGRKLTKRVLRELCQRFFVRGSLKRFAYGGCPQLQMNAAQAGNTEVAAPPWLEKDKSMLERAAGIGIFYYAPRLWMIGEIEPLRALQNHETADSVIDRILEVYPTYQMDGSGAFFRVRVNPEKPSAALQYDSPPEGMSGSNRFDITGGSVLYGSPDLELCMHECRVSAEDEIYFALLVPMKPLKLLDLSVVLREPGVTEFESLDMAVHFLSLAGKHAYPICERIATRVLDAGFDGIIYPSYFSYMRTGAMPFETIYGMSVRRIEQLEPNVKAQTAPNFALFGRPIQEKKLEVHSINRVILNSIQYHKSFGPVLPDR